MLKLRIALCLALVVGTLTLTNGVLHDARVTTIIYRVMISVVLFGVVGYGLAVMGEKIYRELVAKNSNPGEEIEVVPEEQINIVSKEQTNDEVVPEAEFSPFASENFEQISRPKE